VHLTGRAAEKAHGAPLGANEVANTRAALNWPISHSRSRPISRAVAQDRSLGASGPAEWIERTRRHHHSGGRSPFHDALNRKLPCDYTVAMENLRDRFGTERPRWPPAGVATGARRDSASRAEPAGRLRRSYAFQSDSRQRPAARLRDVFEGDYVHHGVREHAMAAAMNGIARTAASFPTRHVSHFRRL